MKLDRRLDGRPTLAFGSGLAIPLGNLAAFCCLAGLALLLAGLSLSLGATRIGPGETLQALFGGDTDADQAFALFQVRLPRILLGFMAGWCVALTGAMLQSLSQNPLADPGLLGLSQGSLVAVMVLLVFFPQVPQAVAPLAALAGALGVGALLLLLVDWRNAGGLAILLMGIALETTLSSVTSILILYAPPETSHGLSEWLAGSLLRSDWPAIAGFAPWFALSLPVVLLLGPRLRTFDMGDTMAMALGEEVRRSKPFILVAAVLLSSASVTAVGPLVFLGILAPHLAGFLTRAAGRARLALSALMGGLLVIAADILTRTATGGVAVPTGLAIVIVGAPLFIVALRLRALRQSRST